MLPCTRWALTERRPVLQVSVQPHPYFKRRGADVLSSKRLRLTSLLLGTTEQVTTVWGTKDVRIPAGTQPGEEIAIPNEGAPNLQRRGRGRHIVKILLDTPSTLSAKQRELIDQLRTEGL